MSGWIDLDDKMYKISNLQQILKMNLKSGDSFNLKGIGLVTIDKVICTKLPLAQVEGDNTHYLSLKCRL